MFAQLHDAARCPHCNGTGTYANPGGLTLGRCYRCGGTGRAGAAAPAASMPAVESAFAKARAAGVKHPKMRLAGFTLSPAPAGGQNPGAIYVKDDKGTYLGKVMAGAFRRSRDCDDATEARIVDVARDPRAAAIAYGKEFGLCSVCGRELSDPESVAAGIGPVCRERFGW